MYFSLHLKKKIIKKAGCPLLPKPHALCITANPPAPTCTQCIASPGAVSYTNLLHLPSGSIKRCRHWDFKSVSFQVLSSDHLKHTDSGIWGNYKYVLKTSQPVLNSRQKFCPSEIAFQKANLSCGMGYWGSVLARRMCSEQVQ